MTESEKEEKDATGFTVWLTGLPCSGKSTIGIEVTRVLNERGLRVERLDGDEVRTHLSKGLGFSRSGRDTNIKRIGWVASMLTRNGLAAVSCFIAPYRSIRAENRKLIGRYVEVFVDCPLEECIKRDTKGMYKKAMKGEIKNFTGISDPYEAPENPEVHLHTDSETVSECVSKIMNKLEELKYF